MRRRTDMDFKEYNRAGIEYLAVTGAALIEDDEIGVSVESDADNVWRVALVHHLLPAENRGKHNVYIEALDEDGQRVSDLEAGWTWEGRRQDEPAPPVKLDKGRDEPAGNLPIFKGQRISAWINGESSDKIHGMHTMHADEGNGNTWGHHSFYVVFQRAVTGVVVPPVGDIEERFMALEKRMANIEGWARGISYE